MESYGDKLMKEIVLKGIKLLVEDETMYNAIVASGVPPDVAAVMVNNVYAWFTLLGNSLATTLDLIPEHEVVFGVITSVAKLQFKITKATQPSS